MSLKNLFATLLAIGLLSTGVVNATEARAAILGTQPEGSLDVSDGFNHSHVLGTITSGGNLFTDSFLDRVSSVKEFSSLSSPTSDSNSIVSSGLDNLGQIIGNSLYSLDGGQFLQGFLAIPVPEPDNYVLFLVGLGAIGVTIWLRQRKIAVSV